MQTSTSLNEAIISTARKWIGTKEVPGKQHNPKIVRMFADSRNDWVKDDETPWCAAFVGSVLQECGIMGTGKLNARSYENWGVPVESPVPGDVAVFWRESPDSWKGHVGFFTREAEDQIYVIGGNQDDAVTEAAFPADRLIGYYRAKQPREKPTQSKTTKASIGQAVAAGSSGIAAYATLDGWAQIVAVAGTFIIFGLAVFVLRERLNAWAAGWR